MHALSAGAIIEKNKLHTDSVFLFLLEVPFVPVYIVRNLDPIEWNGKTYEPFNFILSEFTEDTKSMPSVMLKISNVTRLLQGKVEEFKGGVDQEIVLRMVNSHHLDVTEAEIEMHFQIQKTTIDKDWINFELGSAAVLTCRTPSRRYLKDYCPYPVYKGVECRATSSLPTCGRTLANCRERGNSGRFGGFYAIPQGGMYASN